MKPPTVRFLDQPASLAKQVAGYLLSGAPGCAPDLGGTHVWVPTSGAGRRIRHALARLAADRGTGVLSPRFAQPMQAILPESAPVASRIEREAAWALVLRRASRENSDALFPLATPLAGEHQLLGAGGLLCDLCDLLAEGGHDPLQPDLPDICATDAARWEQIRPLYRQYLETLRSLDLADPNSIRLAEIAKPTIPANLKRLVIACIPDLSQAAAQYAGALLKRGVEVVALIWKPGEMGGGFDEWGRPLSADWARCEVPLAPEQIVVAKDPAAEAAAALHHLALAPTPGDYALVLASADLAPSFGAEILRLGGNPFLPEGSALSSTEPAMAALAWIEWTSTHQLRTLRRLLECPQFARWLGRKTKLSLSKSIMACDFLLCDPLVENLEQAAAYLAKSAEIKDRSAATRADAKALMNGIRDVGAPAVDDVIRQVWSGGGDARAVLDLWAGIGMSPVFRIWPDAMDTAFLRALRTEKTFEASRAGDLEMPGWLEAPWLEAGRMALCGCIEGALPTSVTGHVFLPDSIRTRLGILDNAARRARDAYLLTCLLRTRAPEDFRCSFSKFGPDNSPALPSNLLLRCADGDLPARILATFRPVGGGVAAPLRQNGWRWALPEDKRIRDIATISPTSFKDYLQCPFRYYAARELRLEEFDPHVREMDAARFGTLVHKTLEDFGRFAPDTPDAADIEALVLGHLDAEALRLFGPRPAPAVRVQLEAIRVRLRAFARVQAAEYALGWRILAVEQKLDSNGPDPLRIGPCALSAKIDRIEEHPDLGLRILDYKTYASPKAPVKTHFGSANAVDFLEEAQVTVNGKARSWTDLQLPLYRRIAEKLYPGRAVQTAYFLLPSDPDETGIVALDLPEDLYASAMRCAEAVADRVHRGVFWPPRSVNNSWGDPFEPLFLNGTPEQCFDPETITFLKGRA